MTINIEGKCGAGVTQVLLNCLDVVTVTDRDNSILVTEIMEAEFRAAHLFDDPLEAIIDGAIGQMIAICVG